MPAAVPSPLRFTQTNVQNLLASGGHPTIVSSKVEAYLKKHRDALPSARLSSKQYPHLYVTSDIHADVRRFLQVLVGARLAQLPEGTSIEGEGIYDPALYAGIRWTAPPGTALIILGDLVDGQRGEDSVDDPMGSFELLLHVLLFNLRVSATSRRGAVLFTIGNHDHSTVIAADGGLEHYVHATARQFFGSARNRQHSLRQFYRICPFYALDVDGADKQHAIYMAHAGFNMGSGALASKGKEEPVSQAFHPEALWEELEPAVTAVLREGRFDDLEAVTSVPMQSRGGGKRSRGSGKRSRGGGKRGFAAMYDDDNLLDDDEAPPDEHRNDRGDSWAPAWLRFAPPPAPPLSRIIQQVTWSRLYASQLATLPYGAHSLPSAEAAVCRTAAQSPYSLMVFGHCIVPSLMWRTFRTSSGHREAPGYEGCASMGCVLAACDDAKRGGPSLAFVDVGMAKQNNVQLPEGSPYNAAQPLELLGIHYWNDKVEGDRPFDMYRVRVQPGSAPRLFAITTGGDHTVLAPAEEVADAGVAAASNNNNNYLGGGGRRRRSRRQGGSRQRRTCASRKRRGHAAPYPPCWSAQLSKQERTGLDQQGA